MSAPLARGVAGAGPLFIAWRTGREWSAWHLSAGSGRTVCGLAVPAKPLSTTQRPAEMCTACARVALAQLADPAVATAPADPTIRCENRWKARPGSPGCCDAPAVGFYRRPEQLGGNLNLCHRCAVFLLGQGGVAYRLGPPLAAAASKEPT